MHATEKYDKLCVARNNSSFWADNIIESTQQLKDPVAWQNFYSYLADDTHTYCSWKTSLGECIDDGLEPPLCQTKFNTRVVHNGNVQHIRITPIICNTLLKDNGQPVDRLPQAVSQEAPQDEFKSCDEIRLV